MDLIKIKKGLRGYRWKYLAEGNYSNLANGGESYVELQDLLDSLERVCHLPPRPVGWHQDTDRLSKVYRADGSFVLVELTWL